MSKSHNFAAVLGKIIREWTLLLAMVLGLLYYLAFKEVDLLAPFKSAADRVTDAIMPAFIFVMLFLSFTAVSPKDLKPSRWHLCHAVFQLAVSIGLLFAILPFDVPMASAAFVSFICPTAVASAVITDKLHGNVASLVSYILVVNCIASVAIPVFVPLIPGCSSMEFLPMMWTIMKKIFPLLVLPIIAAWLIRWLLPAVHGFFFGLRWISFYIWALSLVLLVAGIIGSLFADGRLSAGETAIMGISLAACLVQFSAGRLFAKMTGSPREDQVSARQALGQKNTIFAIWLSATFMDPVVAVAPGIYIIWQNIVNSWELRKDLRSK